MGAFAGGNVLQGFVIWNLCIVVHVPGAQFAETQQFWHNTGAVAWRAAKDRQKKRDKRRTGRNSAWKKF